MPKTIYFRAEDLYDFTVSFFKRYHVADEDARIAADVLLSADLRGVDSHGLIRINTYYGSRLAKGLIDPASPITTLRESAVSLALDGGNGLGQVIGYRSMQRCLQKANESGLAMVTVCNSNHYGIAGYYAMMALPENMIGISLTNSQPLVAPTNGRNALLGTNPIAVAIPAGKEQPYVLDMATSIVPIGRVSVYQKAGKPIPEGWGIDKNGNVTENPDEVLEGGALLPLGGTEVMRGYKGYGLSLLVDILSGVLSGASFGPEVGQPKDGKNANVGHFFAAIRIDLFREIMDFKTDMDRFIFLLKNSPLAAGSDRIYIHGEKEFAKEKDFRKNGVPLMEPVVRMLQSAGKEAGVDFNLEVLRSVQEDF
ncbi:MAG: Ldh family oxidoreductase [Anaerolineaceae bacterium]|nr:Ldh family oxidoreductase [Anaerolineaceae bacterium]